MGHTKLDFQQTNIDRYRHISSMNFYVPQTYNSKFVHTMGSEEDSLICSLTLTGKHIWPILMPTTQNNDTSFFDDTGFAKNPNTCEVIREQEANGIESITVKCQQPMEEI